MLKKLFSFVFGISILAIAFGIVVVIQAATWNACRLSHSASYCWNIFAY